MQSNPPPRSACPVAASLDIFGDRWTLLVLRDVLLAGRSRFSELVADEGIATNTLSERLTRLQCQGLLSRERDPKDGRKWIYKPTRAAVELVPVLVEIMLWGSRHTAGQVPAEMLQAAVADKAAFVAQLTALAASRVAA